MEIQKEAFSKIVQDPSKQFLLGFEYDRVLTLGKRAHLKELPPMLQSQFEVIPTDRGGLATLHSRGQLVIYPLVDLKNMNIGVRQFIQNLHSVSSEFLSQLGVQNHWDDDNPQGLFTQKGKIAFCGLRIRSGISTHGISININNQVQDFSLFPACGKCDAEITSVERELRAKNSLLRFSLSEAFEKWSSVWTQIQKENKITP
jgi:lipoyl(octanoyl) transferase